MASHHDDFAGVEDVLRVERALDRAHHRHRLGAVLQLECVPNLSEGRDLAKIERLPETAGLEGLPLPA